MIETKPFHSERFREPPLFDEDGILNPAYIEWAFSQIMRVKTSGVEISVGQKPVQIERVLKIFHVSKLGIVALSQMEKEFAGVALHPRKQVLKAIYAVNKSFEKCGIALEIRGTTISGRKPSDTFYEICVFK